MLASIHTKTCPLTVNYLLIIKYIRLELCLLLHSVSENCETRFNPVSGLQVEINLFGFIEKQKVPSFIMTNQCQKSLSPLEGNVTHH